MDNSHNNNVDQTGAVQEPIDGPSYLNRFGWEKIKDNFGIPVIVRSSGTRYSPVRIVEQEIIKKYDSLPQILFKCITLKSFYLTAVEAKLLNIINLNHCDSRYGELYFSTKDVIISAKDAKELARFLEISKLVFADDMRQLSHKLGLIRLALDPTNLGVKIFVPYVCKYVKGQNKLFRYIPSTFVEPYVINISQKSPADEWDVLIMKMLCVYCTSDRLSFLYPNMFLIPIEGLLYKNNRAPVIYEDFLPEKR